ncbi:MAG TPA: 3-isopropylmalate dehydratase small subunit [Candidatus Dormibacteraeota bacterium]|jgi:3-isopropylmalate/(R)-2-methylmalate dehydratase small subunit|nr:3-isopropylmalate dehydratase small subunit [Candidatus Dormibacteraeota bacterium]
MEPFHRHRGRMAPLERANVDTDQIIPKQFLKRIERSGFGPFLFHDWRRNDPDFVLNRPEYREATVLVAGPNFGCGSSREHAAWSIQDAGFKAVIAPSFGDIFATNSLEIGLLPVRLPEPSVRRLLDLAREDPAAEVEIDLEAQTVTAEGFDEGFEIDPFARDCLLNGWDKVALTLRHEPDIAAYESRRSSWLPRVAVS